MVSLWGSKKDSEEQQHTEDGEQAASSSGHRNDGPSDANEHTRLLPSQQHRGPGYLSPDDPAVSPYNLFSVRAVRYFQVLFLMISFIWWVVLLVSIFVSPPGLQSRGSGFFDFSYTTLTVGTLITALLFFAYPSTPMGVIGSVISLLLLVDTIIILAVGRLRIEEGWVGIASVVWATLIGVYNVLVNRMVRWGKGQEEERLTGRRETKRSIGEWCAVIGETIFMSVMCLIVILLTATLIMRARDASLAAPGTRYYVDGDKYQVHLACFGNQTYDSNGERRPTILLEGGYNPVEESFEDWIYDAVQNGTIDRYCYWDRPGMAWSDNAPSPHSAGMSADALSEALAIADEPGPWILASAGIGSIYSRIFSARHGQEIKGIFMIDPLHEDLLHQVASPGRGFVLWGRGIISPLGLDRLFGAIFQGRSRQDRVYGKYAWQSGKFIKAKLQESLVADSLTKSEVASARTIQLPQVPLTIISSGIHVKKDQEWERKQKDLTNITQNLLVWEVVGGAPSEVWKTLKGREVLEKRLGQMYATT